MDALSGKSVGKEYRVLNESQWFSQSDFEILKIAKLQKLIEHCYKYVPFYSDYMKSINMIPSDVTSLGILEHFPIITKETIKDNYQRFTPLNIRQIKGVKCSQTGGTTGSILFKRNDAATRSIGWASYKRFEDWMGRNSQDRMLLYWGGVAKGSIKSRVVDYIANKLNNAVLYSPEDLTHSQAQAIHGTIIHSKIKFIRTYSQAAFELAKTMQDLGLRSVLKGVTTTAEPVRLEHRNLIRSVFGCEVFDQYGCGEIGGIAYECDHHEGLHVTEEKVILEVDDNKELLVTDLVNYSMPFIRYHNGDEAEFSDGVCSCGRKSTLIKSVLGRTSDYLFLSNGKKVHWGLFLHLLFDTGIANDINLKKFQIRQDSLDSITIRLVSNALTEAHKSKVRKYINDNIGSLSVDFIQEKEIENAASGKYRPVVRNF